MGMFTRVMHPDDGREIQINTGDDLCDSYKVGDKVDWFINKHRAGHGTLLDGVYHGCGYPGEDAWVVIKDHKVHVVLPYDSEDVYEGNLIHQFDIELPHRNLWSEEVWETKRVREEDYRKENEKFNTSIAHLPAGKQAGMRIARPLMRRNNYASIAKEVFKIEPLKKSK